MSARTAPYPAPGYTVRLPARFWSQTLSILRTYGKGRRRQLASEGLVYLAGIPAGSEMIVTGLYDVCHAPQGDHVIVSPDEARWLLRSLRERDEKLIAQIHSHRGAAGHSQGDDAHASSFHDGFLSIVVPRFARGDPRPHECSVLEYRSGAFAELSPASAQRRIHLVEGVWRRSEPSQGVSSWKRFVMRRR